MCGVGVLFIGPFMVVLPLMVRDVYAGGAPQIAWVSTAFPLGTIAGSLVVIRRGGLGELMRSQWVALGIAACILIGMSLGLPFGWTLGGVVLWGVAGSVFMIAGRTLFQQRALHSLRGYFFLPPPLPED